MNPGPILVVDDDPAVLDSLVELLLLDGFEVQAFLSAHDLIDAARIVAPSCIITDLRMPEMDGLTLIEHLAGIGLSACPLVVISGHADVRIAVAAMRMGATTVLEKPFPPQELLAAVHDALAAGRPVAADPALAEARERYRALTAREREVMAHLVGGSSSKVAGRALGISNRTVDVFRAKILSKMAVPNIAALAALFGRGLDG